MRNALALGLMGAAFGVVGLLLAFTWDSTRSGTVLALGAVALLVAVLCVALSVRTSRSNRD